MNPRSLVGQLLLLLALAFPVLAQSNDPPIGGAPVGGGPAVHDPGNDRPIDGRPLGDTAVLDGNHQPIGGPAVNAPAVHDSGNDLPINGDTLEGEPVEEEAPLGGDAVDER